MSLPQSCTVEAPRWRINSKKEIVIDTTVKVHADAYTSSSRRPLRETTNATEKKASMGTNMPSKQAAAASCGENKENNVPVTSGRITRSKAAAAEKEDEKNKKASKWAFKIYDDYVSIKEDKGSKKAPAAEKSDKNDVDELTAKTAAFTLSGGGNSTASNSRRSSAGASAIDNDMFALETMHQRLSQSFKKGAIKSVEVQPDTSAKKWVTRYVDYTSKYGLGFLLNDGSAGVYFNDSTKIVLAPEGETFDYIERKRTDKDKRGEHVSERHTLSVYPPGLQKKVILLKHFRNYLVEQHKKLEEKGESAVGKASFGENKSATDEERRDDGDDKLVYLKKWVRTRHAILFRLSNRTVQVVFFDHTEVLLSCEARSVTYVDKERKRSTLSLAAIMSGSNGRPDIAKRLKYTKDILHQLITGAKR